MPIRVVHCAAVARVAMTTVTPHLAHRLATIPMAMASVPVPVLVSVQVPALVQGLASVQVLALVLVQVPVPVLVSVPAILSVPAATMATVTATITSPHRCLWKHLRASTCQWHKFAFATIQPETSHNPCFPFPIPTRDPRKLQSI